MIHAILQARMSSNRLPNKVLLPIAGVPMLQRQIQRIQRAKQIERLTIATSRETSDDPIEALCKKLRINCYRGSLNDVLDRMYQAALQTSSSHVVRLTGDCPLVDPVLIDVHITRHLNNNNDYTSNTLEPTFPDGLDIEVIRFETLQLAWRESTTPSQREHVTPFIYGDPTRFQLENILSEKALNHLRWTVDEPEDLKFVRSVYDELHESNPNFTTTDVLNLLAAQPHLTKLNSHHTRNQGYLDSLAQEQGSNCP